MREHRGRASRYSRPIRFGEHRDFETDLQRMERAETPFLADGIHHLAQQRCVIKFLIQPSDHLRARRYAPMISRRNRSISSRLLPYWKLSSSSPDSSCSLSDQQRVGTIKRFSVHAVVTKQVEAAVNGTLQNHRAPQAHVA